MLPAYSGAPPTHLQPPASSEAPLARASQTSSPTDDQARITALEGTINQMAANMAELLALLRGPNRAFSSSTPPPGQGPTVDPVPGIPPAQVPENMDAPAPPTLHTSVAQPFTNPYPPPSAPTAVPFPPAAFLSSDQVLSAPPPISMPAPAAAYTIPPPTVFPTSGAPASIHFQTMEFPPYSSLQPQAGLSYPAPPPINTTFHEPGTPAHAAQFASPTHFFPEADAEQECRLKRMEETIRALQANDARPDARYGDCSLFPGMQLPPKFEEYAAKWRAQVAKHIPPINEAQQVQLFHSTLRGIYYSHLLAHTSSFSDLIEAGKKIDLGIKLGRMEGPDDKREEPSRKAPATSPSSRGRRGKEYSVDLTTTPTAAPTYFPPPPQHQPQPIYYSAPPVSPATTSKSYDSYAPASAQSPQPRPPVSRAPPPAQ
ncbi:hypothetical protein CRG98_046912 [Punica granatum]|uniref:Extensin-like n=1 Tax=Punica granatum TaxID=22663 RepID=A0A2I0HLV6_PUNGR|nr:hypothetical protein CRG98_046912 [Punica granatum]